MVCLEQIALCGMSNKLQMESTGKMLSLEPYYCLIRNLSSQPDCATNQTTSIPRPLKHLFQCC